MEVSSRRKDLDVKCRREREIRVPSPVYYLRSGLWTVGPSPRKFTGPGVQGRDVKTSSRRVPRLTITVW